MQDDCGLGGGAVKRVLPLLLLLCGLCTALTGCSGQTGDLKGAYVLITKSAGNPYNTLMAQGFEESIRECGGSPVILEPEKATAEEQISLINACIRGKVRSISIAANDTTALNPSLQRAMEQGIVISTLDSNTSEDSHILFVNQVSAETLAQNLMDAVYDLSGGGGTWAILSTTNQAGNQSAWIKAMQALMTQAPYQDLRLVSIAFGEDNAQLSREKVEKILEECPDLKVLCAPTVVGMRAAAEVLAERGSDVRLTGLGLPSEMAEFMGRDAPICPVMYLWNPIAMGKLSGYISIALTEGTITGAPGETLQIPDGREYRIVERPLGGSEVVVGEPQKFTPDNIREWQDIF